jgi:hypothetical protein
VFDHPESDDASEAVFPVGDSEPNVFGASHGALASSGPDGGLTLEFPVEIEVRLVAPYDHEQLVTMALERLTAALEGLA